MKLVRAFAALRGVTLILFSAAFVLAPEKMMPGSSAEPARSIALIFVSRNVVYGGAYVVLALRGLKRALGWLFLADFVFQIFDTGLAIASHKGAVAGMPAVIGGLALW